MGNCWPKPVEILPSANTRSTSPVRKDDAKPKHKPSPAADYGGRVEKAPASKQIITPNLKMFRLAELRSATRNFRPDSMIGEGGFGCVFKGYIDEKTLAPAKVGIGMPVAVKKSSRDSAQGFKEWQAEVKFLGKFSHANLVKLIGYCWEDEQYLLVYEYMQKGSLESHLFRKGGGDVMPWDLRIKVAIGAARGAAFLHSLKNK